MRTIKVIKSVHWFLLGVLCICLWPLYGHIWNSYRPLGGVSIQSELPQVSEESILRGDWQSGFDTWWQDHIPGRNILIRTRNEIIYRVFRTSPTGNVVEGRNRYLYGPSYLYYYCTKAEDFPDDYIEGLVRKLEELQTLLESHGKSLYLFLTPTKLRYTAEQGLPWYMNTSMHEIDRHDLFVEALADSDIHYFDSVSFFRDNPGLFDTPIFYPPGIHWDTCWAAAAAAAFLSYINETGPYDVGSMTVEGKPTDTPFGSNADLYDMMNVWTSPTLKNLQREVTLYPGTDRPGLFVRTSSFGAASLLHLTRSDNFGATTYFENRAYVRRNEQGESEVNYNVTDYSQVDLAAAFKESDIFVIEILEDHIPDLGEGNMVDYILENGQWLD